MKKLKKYVVMIKHVQLMNVQINIHLLVKIHLLIFNDSGIPIPLEKCCRKKCGEWFNEIGTCPEGSNDLDTEKDGYSIEECCFETCGSWNKRMIKEKVKQRFDNVSDLLNIEVHFQNDDIFPNNRKIITNTDEQIITLLNEFEDNGSEKITNCGYNQEINTYKQGSTEAESLF